jgi:CXXX repeat radical SAM target protein
MNDNLGRRRFLRAGASVVLPALAVLGMAGANPRASMACEGCADACFSTCKDNCEGTCKGNCKGDCSGSSKP